jgi:transcriptional regulator with XRE-family HTH domain
MIVEADDLAPTQRSARKSGQVRSTIDNQRATFLRMCRERLNPEDVGLPRRTNARKPGLRREEVAAISGVGASWYAWLERGCDIRVSDEVLDRLSETLRMTDDERVYLYSLVQHRPPPMSVEVQPEPPANVLQMVHSVPVPAIVVNLCWDLLGWNTLQSQLYKDYSTIPSTERNLLEIVFTRPARYLSAAQFDITTRCLVSRFRYDYSRTGDDPRFEALVHRLCTRSPLFSRLWRSPEFTLQPFGVHRFTHPGYGELEFEHTSFVPDGCSNFRVVVCTPENAATRRALAIAKAEIGSRAR